MIPPTQLGLDDRAFTLFQFSGLFASPFDNAITLAGLQQALKLHRYFPDGSSALVSYQQLRLLFERLWLGRHNDRATALFSHAAQVNYASFGAISLAALTLPGSEESIRFCARHFRTPWSAVPEINRDGNLSMLHIPKFYDPELRATLEHFHFINCFAVSRSHTPGIPIADRVRFTASCGIAKSALERFFGCPVIVGEGIAQIDFSRSWLKRPVPPLSAALRPQAEQKAQEILSTSLTDNPSLRQFLAAHLDRINSADDMAALLGISRRTLARQLDREGASYSLLSREVRLTESRRMLRDGVTTAQIAENLGFSDERSFRRAFRTWCGSSPSEYRGSQQRFYQH